MTEQEIKAAVREAIIEAGIALQYDSWLTKDEAAKYARMSPSSLETLIRRQAIPFHQRKKGAKILFRKSELDEWLTMPQKTGSLKDTIRRIRKNGR